MFVGSAQKYFRVPDGPRRRVIKKLGGSVKAMYTVLGPYAVILIVDLPGTSEAMQASIEVSKLTNIAFTTSPAITVEKFDTIMG